MNALLNKYLIIHHITVIGLVWLHFCFGWISLRYQAPTADEFSYISTAYLYVKTGDFRLDRTHPPLLRLLMGLPLQSANVSLPSLQQEKWSTPESAMLGYVIGWEMLLGGQNDWRQLVTLARLPILFLSCGLALLLYFWASELYGKAGASVVLFLYALSPNMLAHASLATMDLGISFFFVACLYSAFHYNKTLKPHTLVMTGLLLGLALTAKVTALLLIAPIASALWLSKEDGLIRHDASIVTNWALKCLLVLSCAMCSMMLVHGYPLKPFYFGETLSNVWIKSTQTGGEPLPGMPHTNYAFYLLGDYSTSGWFYYYPIALLVKTPLSVLLLLLITLIWSRMRWLKTADALIVGTIIILLLASMFNRVNIGIRHILPLYPLLFLYIGRVALIPSKRLRCVVVPLLLSWHLAASVWISPHYLAYFNEAAGGPQSGHTILDDSNIDWGQDLAALKEVQEQYPNEPFYIATNWMFHPAAFGVHAELLQENQIPIPPKGIVAVGKHWAIRHRIHQRSPYYFDWFEKYQPIDEVGYSILLYHFE